MLQGTGDREMPELMADDGRSNVEAGRPLRSRVSAGAGLCALAIVRSSSGRYSAPDGQVHGLGQVCKDHRA